MTKEEQIKVYSAYLPYMLEIIRTGSESKIENTETLLGITNHFHEPYITTEFNDFYFDDFKPILYDLSYLTKEIEHEGERFVPFNYLSPFLRSKIEFSKHIPHIDLFRVKDYRLLLKWHFNVFSLPEDKFINKATLGKKFPVS